MKILENREELSDYAGRYPVCTVKGAELAKIAEWLYTKYQGYKFGIVFNVCNEDYPIPEKAADFTVDVLFLDDIFEEAVAYMGREEAIKQLIKEGEK